MLFAHESSVPGCTPHHRCYADAPTARDTRKPRQLRHATAKIEEHMKLTDTSFPSEKLPSDEQLRRTVERVLGRADAAAQTTIYPESTGSTAQRRVLDTRAREISDNQREHSEFDGEQEDLAERRALRRVAGLSTELDDVTEVEYRQLRLERVVLAGLWTEGTVEDAENSLRELAALAETAGSEVLDGLVQRRLKPDPGTFLGSGKALELKDIVEATGADTVIVDSELAPSQRRALEDIVKVKVIDRTALILDIFAQHAKSREGKAQVELAQLEYMLPRLRGWGASLSRQAGGRAASGEGIGSRGPGETKIEMDRRRLRARMAKLKREIAAMAPARETKRLSRKRNRVPSVAIAGYTNAGKSSLLNRLTDAGVLVENALFATLDPTVRKAQTPDGIGYTLSDTVGFVRSLPTQLVEAFRSTLEEVADADVILHVVDASHPDPEGQIRAVREVIADLDARRIPEIIVLNKADAADPFILERMRQREPNHVIVSARTGEGIDELKQKIADTIPRPSLEVKLLIPYNHGEVISRLHAWDAEIKSTAFVSDGTFVTALVREDVAAELSDYVIDGELLEVLELELQDSASEPENVCELA